MENWWKSLRFDPISPLASSDNGAIEYYAKRDLLDEEVEPIGQLWQLPEAQKIVRKQQANGSWKYPGKEKVVYPRHHYRLLETWKQFRLLVERYEFTREHPGARKAAEFLFSCQTDDGDFRGFIGNQYAPYYTGAIMALLIRAGYEDDLRIEKGFRWLLSMRQDDGGWTIPILTHRFGREAIYRLTSQYADPVEPDRSKPFSHNWTDMVLRAFVAHPKYGKSEEAKIAGNLLKSRFFQPDVYSSYKAVSYWVRFRFWWPNLLTALSSLSLMGFSKDDPDIKKALDWFTDNQEPDGLWKTSYVKGKEVAENEKTMAMRMWVSLAICRTLRRFYES